MDKFFGIWGIIFILFLSFLMSNNKKRISYKTIISSFLLQIALGVFILKIPIGIKIFEAIGGFIQKILDFSKIGLDFVFGPLTSEPQKLIELFGPNSHIFALHLMGAMIFVMVLVNILYYYGIMQRIVAFLGKIMNKLLNVSGAEALSNLASSFVGQVAAQSLIKPYLPNLTKSEILASMTGSLACISGGVMAIYVGMGIPAQYLLAASIMAAPGALLISKIVYPEVDEPKTMNDIKISKRRTHVNVIDSIAVGAQEGMRVTINVVAVLIALVALIAMIDWLLVKFGLFLHNNLHLSQTFLTFDLTNLSMKMIVGKIFAIFAYLMGVPINEAASVGALLGEKLILNETIAYIDLISIKSMISEKSFIIATFALCGFANLGSIAILIGGVGEMAPKQRKNLSRLGLKALICGTFASYISACIAGILL